MIDLSDFNTITQADLNYNDLYGMGLAFTEAKRSSHTTQVGAWIDGTGAWNDGPHHAESLALLHCARIGKRTQDGTMYASWASCIHCARDIVAAGVRRVVTSKIILDKTPDRWLTSVEEGLSFLYEHNVWVDIVDTRSGYFGHKILMDGKEVEV